MHNEAVVGADAWVALHDVNSAPNGVDERRVGVEKDLETNYGRLKQG